MKARASCSHPEPLETRIAPAFVAGVVNLADLAGGDGSAFHGAAAGHSAGQSVSAAGDVNGDGYGDFIVGVPGSDFGRGAARVVFGAPQGFVADALLDSTDGFTLYGGAGGDSAGSSVGPAGDVNGDGFADVIVGAPGADGGKGAAYVIFGKAGGPGDLTLSALDGRAGFIITGAASGNHAGCAVSGAGDVNGDGFDDVILGAYGVSGQKGAAFIIYGKAGGFAANLALSGLTAAQGVQLNGANSSDYTGAAVSGVGDVNGDGFADVAVGAPFAAEGGANRGATYVVFGGNALGASIALGSLGGASGFRASGESNNDAAGRTVGAAGDVNGDGLADVIVGALRDGGGLPVTGPGAAYVILGNSVPFAPQFSLSAAIKLGGAAGDVAGSDVSTAGDVNGDGIDDLIIGATQNNAGGVGAAYVVLGRTNFATVPPVLTALDGSNGFKLVGEASGDKAGFSVSGAGDVNGDGFADMLVATPYSAEGGANAGKAYLVYGGPTGAFVFPDGISPKLNFATFTDVDGDKVTIKSSKPAFNPNGSQFALLKSSSSAVGAQLLTLDLRAGFDGTSFADADISITVKRMPGGDGFVNVGFIDATGVDLGKVTVMGDLERIDAGDATADLSLKSLTVGSMGLFDGRTADTGAGNRTSVIHGAMGPLKVAGDMAGNFAVFRAAGASSGADLASVTIGGSLIGGAIDSSGRIFARDHIGSVTIGGDVIGGTGVATGHISAGSNSGPGSVGNVTVKGSLIGGRGDFSGEIFSFGSLGNVTLGGSQLGGTGRNSGVIGSDASIGKVSIGGDQIGLGPVSAFVVAKTTIAGVTIGGDARVGTPSGGGGIFATGALGPVIIKGDVIGTAEHPFFIEGGGPLTGAKSVGIASVTIGGDFEHGIIDTSNATIPGNGHGQIGAISVGGDWIASSAVAGVTDAAGRLAAIGSGSDIFQTAGPAGVVASIKSVTIKGAARGTFETGDCFGIVAETIGSVSIGGAKLALTKSTTADPANDLAAIHVGATPDFVVREISRTAAQPAEPNVVTPAAGPRSAWPANFDLGTLNGTNGFTIDAGVPGFVANAGDLNGDGFDDVIMADYNADGQRGAAYVVFGKAGGFSANVPFSSLDGNNGFKITGATSTEQAARSVAAAGDVNGDGVDDLIVGTFTNKAYVVLGRSSFAATLDLGTLDGTNGFKLTGAAGDSAGISVGGGVDVNGDGLGDVIVGSSGEAYVVFGQKNPAATIALGALGGTAGFKLTGPGQAGFYVGGAGDVNGDGRGDVIVGGRTTNAAWVIFGAADFSSTPVIALATLDGANGFTISGAGAGDNPVNAAGDVNGDGFADVIVGASSAGSPATGAATVVFGRARFTSSPSPGFAIAVPSLDGTDGFTLTGVAAGDHAGFAVSGGGDVNGDGFSDLLVGADQSGTGNGAAYIVFGKASGFAASMALSSLDGANGFKLPGLATTALTGFAVSMAGDMNGDGYTDFIIGTQDYVVFGGPSGEYIDPTFSTDHKTAMWTDVDGDLVTLKVSKGTLDATNFSLLANSSTDSHARLLGLYVGVVAGTLSEFDGSDITLTAKRAGGGDGKVNLGFLQAANTDLGAVKIGGDLAQMFVGDADDGMALKSLTLDSSGIFGARTQDTGGGQLIYVAGPAGPVKIAGDVRGTQFLDVAAATPGSGKFVSITIGGSLAGDARLNSGQFFATTLGPVKIGGDLVGGSGDSSGLVLGGTMGSFMVGGSMRGGSGQFSGSVQSFSSIGNITVGGSLLGGDGVASGAIFTAGSIGKIGIKRDQIGRGLASGLIFANGGSSNIASVTIGGDARGGDAAFAGGILAGGTLGPVAVKGDVIGTAAQPFTIRGSGPLTGAKSVAIASVTVGGDLDRALILAGFGQSNAPENGHAQVGAISVGGDWLASSVTAGLLPHAGAPDALGVFGNGDDRFIAAGPTGVAASIASITIKGRALGSLAAGDFFGIVAEQIGSLKLGGVKVAFTTGPSNDAGYFIGSTPDFFIGELGRI